MLPQATGAVRRTQPEIKPPAFPGDQNQEALAGEFEKAAAAGTLGSDPTARKGSTPTTTIRLDPEDVAKARAQAEQHGLRYQTYLKMLIHQALRQAETPAKTRHR